jgi:dihydroflavonol-4-reductase
VNTLGFDTSAPVLVTGATGYIAGWIVRRLVHEGFTVHATVRDPSNQGKVRHLRALDDEGPGSIRFFKADLLDRNAFASPMADCQVVFHTASPFVLWVEDPQRDLVDPAKLGTRHVLEQAGKTDSVRRVVLTSSCAAIYGDNRDIEQTPGDRFTESDWNSSSSIDHQPYSFSKVVAEREAWTIARAQNRWDLVVINPSLVVGPGINPNSTSESLSLIQRLGNGKMKSGVPDYYVGAVDVGDVADAHFAAAFTKSASGRYIISGHDTGFPEFASILRRRFGSRFPFPTRTLPKFLVWLVAPIVDKSLTRKIVSRNVGVPFRADNGKSVRELGMVYRPLEESLVEMFQQMIDSGLVEP